MANRLLNQFKGSYDKGIVHIQGILTIAAGGALSSESMVGASAAKTGTGVYTITLQDKFNEAKAIMVSMESATAQDLDVKIQSSDVSGAQTVIVRTDSAGVATDAVAAIKIHVLMVLKNSSVLP